VLPSALIAAVALACSASPRAIPNLAGQGATLARVFTSSFHRTETITAPAGRWSAPSGELVLVERRSPHNDRTGVFGALPWGADEGALWLTQIDETSWQGEYLGVRDGRRITARAVLRGTTLAVELGSKAITFSRVGPVRTDLLAAIAILGHRGGSFGQAHRDNTIAAIRDSWMIGSSGVELDVTVPHSDAREPLPASLVLHHPSEWRSEITGFDSSSVSAVRESPDVASGLRAAADAGVGVVYLDPKLRWLLPQQRAAAREALTLMARHAASTPRVTVVIGAETSAPGQAAEMLSDLRRSELWAPNLRWAIEITRGTDLDAALQSIRDSSAAPHAVSWNLLRVSDGGGGFLRWFVKSIPAAIESGLASRPAAHIVWTATSADQYEAALRSLTRIRPDLGDVGIMTPHPHRLAFFLATRPGP
jgi:hypothetical protein